MNLRLALCLAFVAGCSEKRVPQASSPPGPPVSIAPYSLPGTGEEIRTAFRLAGRVQMTLRRDGTAVSETVKTRKKDSVWTRTVLRPDQERLVFSKAALEIDGKPARVAFLDRPILKSLSSFRLEDGRTLDPSDLDAAKKLLGEKDERIPDAYFVPAREVRAGESWTLDLEVLRKELASPNIDFDAAGGRGTMRLAAVETRQGIRFGRFEGSVRLPITRVGLMTLESPIDLSISIQADRCIDGTVRTGTLTVRTEIAGDSDFRIQGMKGDWELALDAREEYSWREEGPRREAPQTSMDSSSLRRDGELPGGDEAPLALDRFRNEEGGVFGYRNRRGIRSVTIHADQGSFQGRLASP